MPKQAIFWSKHKPTKDQINDANENLGCEALIHVPAVDEIDPNASQDDVKKIADCEAAKILAAASETASAVVVLGGGLPELWIYLLPMLSPAKLIYTSTTKREVKELGVDEKTGEIKTETTFKHIQYRRVA